MTKYSSFKEQQLIIEGWRKFVNEAQEQKKIFVLVGPPSVGKSTWISNTFGQSRPYIINRDDIAESVANEYGWSYDDMFVPPPQDAKLGDTNSKYGTVVKSPDFMTWQPLSFDKILQANNKVQKLFSERVANAASSNQDIVVDMTNMSAGARKAALKPIEGREGEYKKVAVVFEFEGAEELILQVAQKRAEVAKQMGKSKTIPDSAMRRMFASYQKVSPNEGFDEVVSVDNRQALQSLISGGKEMTVTETIYHGAHLDDGTLVCEGCLQELLESDRIIIQEAKYQGRTVTLNKPTKGDVKKFKVYVKDPSTGNVKKVNFGDPNMKIKKNIPARRKSFRARHNCENPGPKTKARYWSCKKW